MLQPKTLGAGDQFGNTTAITGVPGAAVLLVGSPGVNNSLGSLHAYRDESLVQPEPMPITKSTGLNKKTMIGVSGAIFIIFIIAIIIAIITKKRNEHL